MAADFISDYERPSRKASRTEVAATICEHFMRHHFGVRSCLLVPGEVIALRVRDERSPSDNIEEVPRHTKESCEDWERLLYGTAQRSPQLVEDLKGAVAYGSSLQEVAEFLYRSGTPGDVAAKANELGLTWQRGGMKRDRA
jgi:hypothetical protein